MQTSTHTTASDTSDMGTNDGEVENRNTQDTTKPTMQSTMRGEVNPYFNLIQNLTCTLTHCTPNKSYCILHNSYSILHTVDILIV